jgi:hypothetical protein
VPRQVRRIVVLLLLLATGSPLWAADVPISVVSLTSPVAPFTDATLQIQTTPGASCSVTVLYKSGPSRAKGLYPQTADGKGQITWRWRVGSNTTPGRWPIVVRCGNGGDTGELRTSFEVR